MNKLNLIKMIAVTTGFLTAVVLLQSVNGQSYTEDAQQTIDSTVTNVVRDCSILFDTGDTESNQSVLCDKLMDSIDEECRNNYHDYCFGVSWTNYDSEQKTYRSLDK